MRGGAETGTQSSSKGTGSRAREGEISELAADTAAPKLFFALFLRPQYQLDVKLKHGMR